MNYCSNALSIYNAQYALQYEQLYITPWVRKHNMNIANIKCILGGLVDRGSWLDIACGQGWHFSQIPPSMVKIGVDISSAQLAIARTRNPDSAFIRGDIGSIEFKDRSFDLI